MNNEQLRQKRELEPGEIDLSAYRHIHFVGIGGVSMSALAEIMRTRAATVTGSDSTESEATRSLRKSGINVKIGHAAEHVEGADLVVYTAAVQQDNEELCAARSAGIETLERARFLGAILRLYGCPIGVSGTHGKTTTTSMISQILLEGAYDPTVLIGGTLPLIGQNYKVGESPYIVYEACEYVDSFLHFHSRITLILNIDKDHLDYFAGIEQIKASFKQFADRTLAGGCVIANADDEAVMSALRGHAGRIVTFSAQDPSADYFGKLLQQGAEMDFEVFERGVPQGRCRLQVPGLHNLKNALAAIAACRVIGVPFETAFAALKSFGGAKRRFERKGTWNGVLVVDDYAHHPTEISATLQAAKALDHSRVVCVFQPHTYSRTKALFDEFAAALSIADLAVVADIYAAREAFDASVSAGQLAERIPGARYAPSHRDALELLKRELRPGDLLLTMGAGDIYEVGEALLAGQG